MDERKVMIQTLQADVSKLLREASILAQRFKKLESEEKDEEYKPQLTKPVPPPVRLIKDDGISKPKIDKDELYQKFNNMAIPVSDAQALTNKKIDEMQVSLVLGFKTGCGSCTEVFKELYTTQFDLKMFGTITTTSIYYNKILNIYKINGNPFLLVISGGKVLPPILGWNIIKTLKGILK